MRRAFSLLLTVSCLCLCAEAAARAQQPPTPTPVNRPAYVPTQPAVKQDAGQSPQTQTEIKPDQSGEYTIHRTSRLVLLDVVVTDSTGHPVSGLQQSDFKITEQKQPQTILHFETSGAVMPDPDVAIDSTATLDAEAPRAPVTILVLDEFNTRFEDMAFARYSLKKYLEKQPDKLNTPTMLLAVTLQKFTVLQDYTEDKKALVDALDHSLAVNPWQLRSIDWIPDRFAMAFATLMRVAEASEGHPGHKNMIWIGRGFPALDYTSVPIDSLNRVNSIVQQCVNMLRDARITLYTVDPAGLMIRPDEYGPFAALDDPFGGNYQFSLLAKATGGRALYGRNDVDAEIGTTIRDGQEFYTLAYRPTDDSHDPEKFRKIQVTLDRPGLTATTREGYYVQTPPGLVNHDMPSRRLAFDLISADTSRMVYDAVPLSLTEQPGTPNAFNIHVDPKALVWTTAHDGTPRGTQVILLASLFDRKDNELFRDVKIIHVNATGEVPSTGRLERSLELAYTLPKNKKAVRARFIVRVSATGRLGSVDVPLTGTTAEIPAKMPTPSAP
jgi:VWFA-related protein